MKNGRFFEKNYLLDTFVVFSMEKCCHHAISPSSYPFWHLEGEIFSNFIAKLRKDVLESLCCMLCDLGTCGQIARQQQSLWTERHDHRQQLWMRFL